MTGDQSDPRNNSQAALASAETGMVRKKLTQADIAKAIKLHQDYRNGVFGGRRAIFSLRIWKA